MRHKSHLRYRVAADLVFLAHLALVVFVLIGWIFPAVRSLYVAVLALILIADLFFGYCILSKIEFDLRRKFDSRYAQATKWTAFYVKKFTRIEVPAAVFRPLTFICVSALIILTLAMS